MAVQSPSFFFYDLETTGLNPREARIMQFAGQRTTLDLKPVGEPVNVLIALTPDVVPDPDAILVTGITPQQTIMDGVGEAEFLRMFHEDITTPGTIFTGYNTVRFDDEFMRYTNYRNFYDPYEWHWKDGRSRWDLIDVVRMTRALRPEGITWPFGADGSATNRLEVLTSVNGLDHENAHDALSDVLATIAVARLIRSKQPKLFEFLLRMRDKKQVAELVQSGDPFIYTASTYPAKFNKTTVVAAIGKHPKQQGVLVFDLRHNPEDYLAMSIDELTEAWRPKKADAPGPRLPIKTLQFNRCPAVAPLSVLTQTSPEALEALNIDMEVVRANRQRLRTNAKKFTDKLMQALERLDVAQQASILTDDQTVDGQLYDGFSSDADRQKLRVVRAADPSELSSLDLQFEDKRLNTLLPLYKGRNFPQALTAEERTTWENFCKQRLLGGGRSSRMAKYFERLQALAARPDLTSDQQYLLEELRLYGETVMPVDVDG